MIRTDVLIIGAGLLGCFTARNLTRYDADVIVLEKESDVCWGISKANTGIIYSGYNNKPGSEKQKLCVQANDAFDQLCGELEVPFRRPGSLMVSYGPSGDAVIERKFRDGLNGGVSGLKFLSGKEAAAMEPALAAGITSALYSSGTGTVDPWDLCIAAYENARDNGAHFVFGCRVTEIRRESGGFAVMTETGSYFARAVVNAAGLSSDSVREMTERPLIRLFPSAADYIVLDRTAGDTVRHIILHEGEDGKGLTLVPTVDGNLLIGPTNREAGEAEAGCCDMRTDRAGLEFLKELCKKIVPELDLSQQIRTFGSLRPDPYYVTYEDGRLIRDERSIKDIRIIEENGLFSLIGIKTPGLTFANELGRIVADKAAACAGRTEANPAFDPHRKAIIRARDLSEEDRADLIGRDSAYGEVICSCMDVTRSEIMQAADRGAGNYESVKRRTGAGLGRCQGSRCRRRIMDITAKGE
ncbi:MAG: NAD(P)/FAD-dependent oxidoreductase [Mogibacterium sp.]|nr:NAD(P)/FAD-dependent oxidoreductase [Mogibacterium sp.]